MRKDSCYDVKAAQPQGMLQRQKRRNRRPTYWMLLGFLMVAHLVMAQTPNARTIKGLVFDENGSPVIGASVSIPHTNRGTVTGIHGEYVLFVPERSDSLRFSYIGYQTITVPLHKAARIQMAPNVQAINEVVVTGIFSRKAESYTGSAVTLSSKDLARVSNQNVFESLKSLDPSLQILPNLANGSDPNSLPSMQLRGASTFPQEATSGSSYSLKSNFADAPNTPLFILDGFEEKIEKIMDMDMARIASITILKDASAKAIYGSKAANGVVVIETKRLTANETRVTYTGSVDIEMPDLSSYNLCNSLEKLAVENIEGYYANSQTFLTEQIRALNVYNDRLKAAQEGLDTYWLSKPLRTGVGQKHVVEVEMGENALKAYASIMYKNVAGVMKGSNRETFSGDLNLSYRYKNVLFRNIMSIASNTSDDSPYGSFSDYSQLNPYLSPYDAQGKIKRQLTNAEESSLFGTIGNPLYDAQLNTLLQHKYLHFTNNFQLEVNILKELKAIARVGISSKWTKGDTFYPGEHSRFISYTSESDKARRGSYEATNGEASSVSGDFRLQYNKNFGKHDLFATAQMEISQSKYTETTHYAEGFPNQNMNNIIFARQYAEGMTPTGTEGLNRSLSYLGYLTYTYDNRYATDLTVRTGACSMYGSNNRWGTFWSAGLAWMMHNESFLKEVSWIQELKLRSSVGTTGNQNFRQNLAIPIYNYITDRYYLNYAGALLANMENPTLGWEQKMDYSIGLDARITRLALKAEYYLADTKNMVIARSIVPSTGFLSINDNLGQVRNQGWDIQATVTALKNQAGFLNINASIVTNDNKIRKITQEMREYNKQQAVKASQLYQSTPVIQYEEGLPLNSIWAVPSLGIDPQSGKEIFRKKDGTLTTEWNANDRICCGTSDSKFNGILGANGEYKGIGLSVALTYRGGGKYYNNTLVDRVENADLLYNVDKRVFSGRWQQAGQNAQFKGFDTTDILDADGKSTHVKTQATTRFAQDLNELDLTSIAAYYEFNAKTLQQMHLKRLRVSAYLNNVATFSSVKIERGLSYPFARTLSFAVSATF